MVVDRRERTEQLEFMKERVKATIEALTQLEVFTDTAIAKAKASLEELQKSRANVQI